MSSKTSSYGNDLQPKIFVPNLLVRWPYPRRFNTHHVPVKKASAAWIESFGAFSPRAQHAFNRCDFARLGSLAYPTANKGHLRAGCDFMNLVFFMDEYTDVSEPSEVEMQREVVTDALRNPHTPRPKGEWVGGEIVRQFLERAIKNGASKQSQKNFVETFDEYLLGTLQQTVERGEHYIRDIKSYFEIRRITIGAKPAFALLEQPFDIPDEVMAHPAVQEMVLDAVDMILIANDVTSYNIEQSIGDDDHNIITIVIKELGTDVNGAMLWAQDYHSKTEQKFLAAMASLPEWEEPLNSHVRVYCHGLGNWVRANHDWNFEGGRYFGDRGLEIMEKGWMSLMPKRGNGKLEVGPVLVDSSLL